MGSSDFWFVISMVLLLATLVAKIFSVASLTTLRKELQVVKHRKKNKLKELHRAKNQKGVLNANINVLKKKKDGLMKRLISMEKEVEEFEKQEKKREERYSSNKVER